MWEAIALQETERPGWADLVPWMRPKAKHLDACGRGTGATTLSVGFGGGLQGDSTRWA